MRSSIACVRCRRSKVKCLNNGVNTPCRACSVAGRECVYPSPASGDRSHRRDGSLGRTAAEALGTPDAPRSARQKPRKTISAFNLQSHRALVDALDPSILTQHIWLELFDIWQLHYAVDLPFLHSPSFSKLLSQAKGAPAVQSFAMPKVEGPDQLPDAPKELLLAFLALTSRFHAALVAHHSPGTASRPSNPLVAADYYAAACKNQLTSLGDSPPDLARVQTLLILAFHEWGSCQSIGAWTYLGNAIRAAHLIGLNYQEDLDTLVSKLLVVQPQRLESTLSSSSSPEDVWREQETKRRTYWACFLVERCLSSGRFRPLSIRIEDVNIQLPASHRAYLFDERVQTPLLSDSINDFHRSLNGEQNATSSGSIHSTLNHPQSPNKAREALDQGVPWETGPLEGLVSRYVKASEAYNAVLQWACRGGRLTERYPPWDPQSTWRALYRTVNQLIEKLPRDLALSQANISAHITSRTSAPFTLLHSMLLLSKIILHREFLPFLPIKASHPKGPIDSLSPFMAEIAQHESGSNFWTESASELFKSARDLLNLYLTCSEWKVLVETPLVGFASYMIAVLGVYSTHFPWMDTKEWMSSSQTSDKNNSGFVGSPGPRDADSAQKAINLVTQLRPKLKMADGWFKALSRLHHLFLRTKKELRRNYKLPPFSSNESLQGRMQLHPLRMGDEVYKQLDAALGVEASPLFEDSEMADAPAAAKDESIAHSHTTEGAARDTWASVNALTSTPQASQPANGFTTSYQSPSGPSGHTSTYPPISPPGHPPSQPYTPTQMLYNATSYPQPKSPPASSHGLDGAVQEIASQPRAPQQPWSQEQLEAWLNSLEVVFGAGDVAAFAEGWEWKDGTQEGLRGWLRLVWVG